MNAFLVPLIASPQKLSIPLGGTIYNLALKWNRFAQAWTLDIADINSVPLVNGIPLICGADLLAQYAYLGFTGKLFAQTDNNPQAPPAFTNLGATGNLYFVTP